MVNKKEGQLGSLIIILVVGLVLVLGVVSLNETVSDKTPESNNSLQSIDIPDVRSLSNKHASKLDQRTQTFFDTIQDVNEEKDFLISFNRVFEGVAHKLELKHHQRFNVATVRGKAIDVAALLENENVALIELDQEINLLETIPYNVEAVRAPDTWDLSNGSGVKVAVLDTGVADHDDLFIANGHSVVSSNYTDIHGHGTAVAGIISALLNGEGSVGVAPDAPLYAVKIMESSSGDLSDAITGVEWAIENDIDIISMSFGMESYSQIFKEVLEDAYNEEILLVASSGNDGEENVLYPAAYSNVIAVGAVDDSNDLASFSNYGFELELVAPGVDIYTTTNDNDFGLFSGTSFAIPHVVGAAVLIKSFNVSLTNEEIRGKLQNDALDLGDSGKDDLFGHGLVQVNLDTGDLSLSNESYFYEIFNISNHGTENENAVFWINGTGNIDDVDYNEGVYLARKYLGEDIVEKFFGVAENGSLFSLGASITFTDSFTEGGSSENDKIAWINEPFYVKLVSNSVDYDAACHDVLDQPKFSHCFFDFNHDKEECDIDSGSIDCGGDTDCDVALNNRGTSHDIFDESTAKSDVIESFAVVGCTGIGGGVSHEQPQSNPNTYYIINKKRALCTNSTHYDLQGHYGTGWVTYASAACGGGCDPSLDEQEVTTKTGAIPSPCVGVCSGSIEINVEDATGEIQSGSFVYLNNILHGTTNLQGQHFIDVTSSACGADQEVKVTCSNNQSKVCGIKETSMDLEDDSDSLFFDCTICNDNYKDIFFDLSDIKIQSSGSNYLITITVHNRNVNANNAKVNIKGVDKDTGLVVEGANVNTAGFSLIASQTTKVVTHTMNLDNVDFLHFYLDVDDVVNDIETNNYVLRPFIKKPIKAFLDVGTGFPKVDEAITNYLSVFFDSQPENSAEVVVSVGKKSQHFGSLNAHTKAQYGFSFDRGTLLFNGKRVGETPYTGITSSFRQPDPPFDQFVVAYGKGLEGDVAAVKRLVSNLPQLRGIGSELTGAINIDVSTYIDRFDANGIAVWDLMHNSENKNKCINPNTDSCKELVEDVLLDNNFEISIKTVKTINDNTTLRLKNLNSDFSAEFRDAVVNNPKPVVMSAGIFSNLFTFEDGLGEELAQEGHDVWLIEMNGGPTTECDNCPDYTYDDQVEFYWPALIAGVSSYSEQNQFNYIGHSNGCRVALSSLNNYSSGKDNAGFVFNTVTGVHDTFADLPNLPVDKFFGIACPATLNDETAFTELARDRGDSAIAKLANKDHVTLFDYTRHLTPSQPSLYFELARLGSLKLLTGNKKISYNLMDFYNDLAVDENSNIKVSGVNTGKLFLFNGEPTDFIVHTNDADTVLTNSSLSVQDKEKREYSNLLSLDNHVSIKDNRLVRHDIKERLGE